MLTMIIHIYIYIDMWLKTRSIYYTHIYIYIYIYIIYIYIYKGLYTCVGVSLYIISYRYKCEILPLKVQQSHIHGAITGVYLTYSDLREHVISPSARLLHIGSSAAPAAILLARQLITLCVCL